MNEENIAVNKLVIEGTLLARDEGAHPDSLHICNLNKLGYFPEHQELAFIIRSHFPVCNTPYGYGVYGKVRITIESLDIGLYAAKRSEEETNDDSCNQALVEQCVKLVEKRLVTAMRI